MASTSRAFASIASRTLADVGFCHLSRAGAPCLAELNQLAGEVPVASAGTRLVGSHLVRSLTDSGACLHNIAVEILGSGARAVRAIWFDKSAAANWSLGWHQDRTIAVRQRHELAGFGPWTVKAGTPHVAPPIELLAQMLTMRVHVDQVDANNAPLLVAPGSHRHGRIAETEIEEVVARCGTHACLAERGDVWLYSTPILHASARASAGKRRRVLQIDFSARDLPSPLEWLGV